MSIMVRKYTQGDLPAMRAIWNGVVDEGRAFPQEEGLSEDEAGAFFAAQSHVGVAEEDGRVLGLYTLHPNNIGRCGHIANTSYAVAAGMRGRHIGEHLVQDSVKMAAVLGFKIMQFNAVVASNAGAVHLYKKLGFTPLGAIPGGFRLDDGRYEDIILFYKVLSEK